MLSEERKERARQFLRNTKFGFDRGLYLNKAYYKYKHINLHEHLRGKIDAGLLDMCPVFIGDEDLIAGGFPPSAPRSEEDGKFLEKFRCRHNLAFLTRRQPICRKYTVHNVFLSFCS